MDYSALAAAPAVQVGARRNVALDSLRVVLALMVVALHGHLLVESHPAVSNALTNYLFRTAVPLFLLINGYFFCLLVTKGGSPMKWAGRVLALYVTWSIAYGYFSFSQGLLGGIRSLVIGYWHLWYLPATILAGLLVYRLRHARTSAVLAIVAALYVVGLVLQYTGNYHHFTGVVDQILSRNYVHRNFLFVGVPMVGLGFLAAREQWHQQQSVRWLAGALVLSILGMGLEYGINNRLGMDPAEGLDSLAALPFVCLPLFLLTMKAPTRVSRLNLAGIATTTYFVHPFFLLLLPAVGVSGSVDLVAAAVAGSLALYPVIAALNRRWLVFI